MKKIFAVLSIATVFVACGGGEQTPAEVAPAAPAVDTTKKDTAVAVAATPAPAAEVKDAHKAKKR